MNSSFTSATKDLKNIASPERKDINVQLNREPLSGSTVMNTSGSNNTTTFPLNINTSGLVGPKLSRKEEVSPNQSFASIRSPELEPSNQTSKVLNTSDSRDNIKPQKENVFTKFESMKKKNELKAVNSTSNPIKGINHFFLFNFLGSMLSDIRKTYSQKDKSTHEKIALVKKALAYEKEMMQKQIFEQINIKNFLNSDKLTLFD